MEFEELSVGDELDARTIELRREETKLLAALLEDPYPPHFNPRYADELGYPDLLNQGPANASFLLQTVVDGLDSPLAVRSFDLRFHDMVFVGETVSATAVVEETRIEGDARIVEFAVALKREDGAVAVDGSVTARVPP